MANKNTKPFILFLLIVLATIALGFGTTQLQKLHPQYEKSGHKPQMTEAEKAQAAEEKRRQKEIKNADYLISRPSQGSLVQTQNITLKYLPNDEASALVLNKHLNKINIRQNVVLYDKSDTTMPVGGRVQSIAPHEDQLEIIIALPKGTKTEYLSNKASIITLDARVSLRYPLSALQQDKNGNYYVWAAEETEERGLFQAKKVWLNTPLIGNDNFVAGPPVGIKTLLILEPNKKVKHTEIYKMAKVKYKAPYHNPIKQAYYDYQIQQRKNRIQQARKRLSDCRANALKNNTPSGAISESCRGDTIDSKADPMDIFNSILSRQPNSNGECSSCGQ